MKKIIKEIVEFFLWLFKSKVPTQPKPTYNYPEYKPNKFDFEIADLLNKYRKEKDLPYLNVGLNKMLCNIAYAHCKYMAFWNKASHDGFQQRADEFPQQRVGEIIAYNFQTPLSNVQAWLTSEHHKAVIDNKIYTSIGLANAVSTAGKKYVTVLFLSDEK